MANSAINQQSNYDLNRALDAAQLSDAAYLVDRGADTAPLVSRLAELGWKPLTSTGQGLVLDAAGGLTAGNGFAPYTDHVGEKSGYAFVATREIGGKKEYAISFAGTNPDDPGDEPSDYAAYGFSKAYVELRPLFAEMVKQAVADKNAGLDVSLLITGHSLGGAIAQAALADLSTDPDTDLWQLSGILKHGDRLYDTSSLLPMRASVAALAPSAQMITFGAPSLLVDPFKLSPADVVVGTLSPAALFALLSAQLAGMVFFDGSNIDSGNGSFFASHAIQFEHGRVIGLPGNDPVAHLGGIDLGQVVQIDLSDVDA